MAPYVDPVAVEERKTPDQDPAGNKSLGPDPPARVNAGSTVPITGTVREKEMVNYSLFTQHNAICNIHSSFIRCLTGRQICKRSQGTV